VKEIKCDGRARAGCHSGCKGSLRFVHDGGVYAVALESGEKQKLASMTAMPLGAALVANSTLPDFRRL
jgi:hypothetical protein